MRPRWDEGDVVRATLLAREIEKSYGEGGDKAASKETKIGSHVQGGYPGVYQTNGMLPFHVGDAIPVKKIGPIEVPIDMSHHHVPGGSTLNIHENTAGGDYLTVPNDHVPPATILSAAETAALTKAGKLLGAN